MSVHNSIGNRSADLERRGLRAHSVPVKPEDSLQPALHAQALHKLLRCVIEPLL
jgi:hypothetical protein